MISHAFITIVPRAEETSPFSISLIRPRLHSRYSPLGNRAASRSRSSLDADLSAAWPGQRFNPKSGHWCARSGNERSTLTLLSVHPMQLHRSPAAGNDAPLATETIHKIYIPRMRESIIAPRSPIPAKWHVHRRWFHEIARTHPHWSRTAADWSSMGPRGHVRPTHQGPSSHLTTISSCELCLFICRSRLSYLCKENVGRTLSTKWYKWLFI